MKTEQIVTTDGALALYLDLPATELVDLEVAAAAVIEWAKGLRAAASVLDPDYDYRVSLIAAEPGSSKWLAAIERSALNETVKRVDRGWKKVPLIFRWTIALAAAIPGSVVPTYRYWTQTEEGFNEKQLHQLEELTRKAGEDPTVRTHRRSMYGHLQRDKKIVGVGTGIAHQLDWKPDRLVPANQFPEATGLFDLQEPGAHERVIYPELDVILVSPHLHNAPRTWVFRQEGLPGTFTAVMRDKEFLAALENDKVHERFRADVPMRVRLEVKQRLVDGEWKVKRQGRSVTEVVSPAAD